MRLSLGSWMDKPIFNNGICVLTDYNGRKFELSEKTWTGHIINDNKRAHLRSQFDKVILALQKPDRLIADSRQRNVVHYEKFFNDFYVLSTALKPAYLYVLVNRKTLRVITVYESKRQRTKGRVLCLTDSST